MLFLKTNYLLVFVTMMVTLTSCFTGVESTKKITAKDVERSIGSKMNYYEPQLEVLLPDSFPNWRIGKQFYITDNNVKKIFTSSSKYDSDTLFVKGDTLIYKGYFNELYLDNEEKISIILSDGKYDHIFATGKTFEEIAKIKNGLTIPFLIDIDLVNIYKKAMVGNQYFLKTPLWYNSEMEAVPGKRFLKVNIIDILPGNSVFPLKVFFCTIDGDSAYVMMSPSYTSVQNRIFNDLFSIKDIRKNYPTINDKNWALIICGDVALEMTKDECRLSLGAPKNIQTIPTYGGLQELWYYEDGTFLRFLDGILQQFRR